MEVLLCERVNNLRHSLFHLNSLITTASEFREQGLDCKEAEELSWCPSCSNSLWQGWSWGLVHCPGGNATDPIWRVLTSSYGISSWTPLKPQHSNPNPNPNHLPINCGVLTSLLLPHLSSSLTDCLPWISYASQKLMLDSYKMVQKQSEAYHMFLCHFFLV